MRYSLFVLSACLATACSSPDSRLAPLRNATLTPGKGLGTLQLGVTTFAAIVKSYGSGVVLPVAGDEQAWELSYEGGQLALMFIVTGDCKEKVSGQRLAGADGLDALFARVPACGDLTLSSINVRGGSSKGSGWFTGKTDRGVSLWSPIDSVHVYGDPQNGPGRFVAGSRMRRPEERIDYTEGVYFYYDRAGGAQSNAGLVKEITVFLPEP